MKDRKIRHTVLKDGLLLIMGVMVFLSSSCKKSPDSIGNELLSENNYIGMYHTDTTCIVAHSVMDSIGSKNVTYALLGSMMDPVFGGTEAGFYTQLHLSSNGQTFGENPVLDSLVLQLNLGGYYGDTTTLQMVHVYRLLDTISSSESYYSYSDINVDPVDYAEGHQFRPTPKTSNMIVGNDTIDRPVVRIPLNHQLGEDLMNLDATAYQNPDAFKAQFNGLYVTCESVGYGGAISYVNLTSNLYSQLQLYYHNDESPDRSLRYDFYITSADNYFNRFKHDYSQGSDAFVSQLINGDTILGQEQVYLQSMGGVKTVIGFPNLQTWGDAFSDEHIVINEAKLILPAIGMEDSTLFTAPQTLVLVGIKDDGTSVLLPDYYEGTTYFGGQYNSLNQSVSFRITEYMQHIIQNKANMKLSLGINGAAYNAQRLIVAGPGANAENKMRLEVTYSVVSE